MSTRSGTPRQRLGRQAFGTVCALVAAASGLVGCGGGAALRVPMAVPVDLVPATLPDPTDLQSGFTLAEYQDARKQFGDAGTRSLVEDGRLWEVRRGANLIGTLEVGTLKPKADVAKADNRKKLIGLIIPGAFTTINVQRVSVVRAATDDKTTYLWFGQGLFELLEIKGAKVEPEQLMRSLIAFQLPTGKLKLTSQVTRRNPLA